LTARIFATVTGAELAAQIASTGIERPKKSEKSRQNGAKTAVFGGDRPHCYIMATMGRKVSLYVKINATACLF
jgi:hypothetical protein